MNNKQSIMKTEYALSSNETVNIIPIGDFHIGSSQFNQEFYEYMLNTIKKLKNRRIYLMGDLLENASKKVGNSAYTTNMSLDEQKEYLLETITPFKEDIIGYAIGNHEARLIKDYDFNIVADISRELNIPYYNQHIDSFKINEYTLDIFTRHGKGSSGKRHLSMGKLERDTEHIVADIYLDELQRGQGLFLTRKTPTAPIYLVGRADGTATAKTTLAKGTASKPTWSLLAAPTTTALDLNSSAFKSDTYAKDTIMLPTTGAGVKIPITYENGNWGGPTSVAFKIGDKTYHYTTRTENVTIPAGTGFWFLNKSAEKDVEWTSGGTN